MPGIHCDVVSLHAFLKCLIAEYICYGFRYEIVHNLHHEIATILTLIVTPSFYHHEFILLRSKMLRINQI